MHLRMEQREQQSRLGALLGVGREANGWGGEWEMCVWEGRGVVGCLALVV